MEHIETRKQEEKEEIKEKVIWEDICQQWNWQTDRYRQRQ